MKILGLKVANYEAKVGIFEPSHARIVVGWL
jgi:hypothetical protein